MKANDNIELMKIDRIPDNPNLYKVTYCRKGSIYECEMSNLSIEALNIISPNYQRDCQDGKKPNFSVICNEGKLEAICNKGGSECNDNYIWLIGPQLWLNANFQSTDITITRITLDANTVTLVCNNLHKIDIPYNCQDIPFNLVSIIAQSFTFLSEYEKKPLYVIQYIQDDVSGKIRPCSILCQS